MGEAEWEGPLVQAETLFFFLSVWVPKGTSAADRREEASLIVHSLRPHHDLVKHSTNWQYVVCYDDHAI